MDFQKEVIDRSFELPVVVDFWAPWCGPCRVLTPIIEKIAEEQAGKWGLVKLNTEEQPDISDTYQIRSIPNVKMFYRGEVINEFLGSLPRQTILDWLRKALPNEGVVALDQLLTEHSTPTTAELETLHERYPECEEIRLVLAQLILWENHDRAAQVLEPFKMSSPFIDKVYSLRDIIALLQYDSQDSIVESIKQKLLASKIEEAIPSILEVLAKDDKAGEGKLAKATIGLFNLLGPHHPLTKQYRKQLDMYLWK
jgi:putative thioredoxin